MKTQFILISLFTIVIFQACKKNDSEKSPVIDFYADRIEVAVGDSITFYPSSNSNTVDFLNWNFYGGSKIPNSPDPTPVVVYNSPGDYSVTLKISAKQNGPLTTLTKEKYIKVH